MHLPYLYLCSDGAHHRRHKPSGHRAFLLRPIAALLDLLRRTSCLCACARTAEEDRTREHNHRRSDASTSLEDVAGAVAGEEAAPPDGPRLFSYAELYIGSRGFSEEELLGSGGFGRVYRAVLPGDGSVVAVKCVAGRRGEGGRVEEKAFAAELTAVARLRHRNLVRLRGWCVDDERLLLVYDYMPNRSLDRLLFRRPGGPAPLPWKKRAGIASGLAAALFYLHEQLDAQIVHRDVKSSNVMLDAAYGARLGDFGLARWLEHDPPAAPAAPPPMQAWPEARRFRLTDASEAGGTIGYLSPESLGGKGGAVTAKSDVFSFGVVALELATGRRAFDLSRPDEEMVLVDWVRRLADDGKNYAVAVDPGLQREEPCFSTDVRRLMDVGLLCSLNDPRSRPSMRWVVEVLADGDRDLPTLPEFKCHPDYYISFSSNASSATTADVSLAVDPEASSTSASSSRPL